jgi:hypothetical protein
MAAPRTAESTVAANHGEHHGLSHDDLTHAHLIAPGRPCRPLGPGSAVPGTWPRLSDTVAGPPSP